MAQPDANVSVKDGERPRGIGFVGLSTQGWAATALVRPLFHPLLASKYTLVALCTRHIESALAAASFYSSPEKPVKAYYGTEGIDALINDPAVDVVAVSVKIPDHFPIVQKAIERGKEVFVEWSPGRGFEETKRIEEMARERGVRVMVGAQGNQSAAVRKVSASHLGMREYGRCGLMHGPCALFAPGEGDN